jgi:hypothetical protein
MWDGFASSSETFDYALNGSLGTGAGTVAMENPGYGFTEGVINAGSDSSIDNIFDSGGSFSVWLSPESQGPTNDGRIIDKSTNGTVGWRLYCDGSNTKLTLLVVTGTTNGEWTFPIDMIGDVWQHVILTYDADASANNPVVYVNGASIAVTETGTPDDTRTSDAGATLYLASEASGGNYYDGSMDDLMFFGRVLGAAEAKSIYEVTRQRYGV